MASRAIKERVPGRKESQQPPPEGSPQPLSPEGSPQPLSPEGSPQPPPEGSQQPPPEGSQQPPPEGSQQPPPDESRAPLHKENGASLPREGEPLTNGSAELAHELERVTEANEKPTTVGELLSSQFSQSINEAMTRRQTLPGFADPRMERVNSIELPPWFVDRCRRAYLSVAFDAETECRVVGVTSPAYGEGKTSVSIGIATAMAVDTKKPTLLIECDFAAPSFFKFFGIKEGGGLSEWLEGGSRLRIVRGAALVPNLFVIPSGAAQTEPARLFYQLVDRNVFDGLRGCFGNVVVDLPPMLNISYGSLASALADRLLIVARSRATLTADLETLVTRIGKDRVSGIVLNGTDYHTPRWLRPLL